jgi:glycosyltransferase involved in cell wall biosynthesis
MTRILFVINNLGVGGAEKVLLSLAAGLDRTRYECVVACIGRDHAMLPRFEEAGVRVETLNARCQVDPYGCARLLALARRFEPQVIHGFLWRANMLARWAGHRCRVPAVVTSEHSVLFDGPLREWVNRRTAHYSSAVVCVSEAARRYVRDHVGLPPELLRVIQNGVDVSAYPPPADRADAKRALGLPGERLIVGTVARHSAEKRLERFIEIAQRVQGVMPEALFVTAGGGATLNQIRERARQLGAEVAFLGHRDDVPAVMAAFDVFVLTSEKEGFPLTVIEAMATECPVVAMLAGGVGDTLRNEVDGMVVEQGDLAGASEAVLRLLRDPGLRRRAGASARVRATEHLSIEAMVQAYGFLYDELLRGCPRP